MQTFSVFYTFRVLRPIDLFVFKVFRDNLNLFIPESMVNWFLCCLFTPLKCCTVFRGFCVCFRCWGSRTPKEVTKQGKTVQTANRAEFYSAWQPGNITSCLSWFLFLWPICSWHLLFFVLWMSSSLRIIDELCASFDFPSPSLPPIPLFLPTL